MNIDDKKIIRIGIVGGGPAAVAACDQFLHAIKPHQQYLNSNGIKFVLSIYEKSDTIGPGIPYSFKDDCYRLNLPIDAMASGFRSELTFSDWLEQRLGKKSESNYPPRYYFGEYLQALFNHLCKQATDFNTEINAYVNTEVVNIHEIKDKNNKNKNENTNNQFEIFVLNQGDTIESAHQFDYVILGTGHMPPVAPKHLSNCENYYNNPWAPSIYNDIHPSSHVALIGSRLTAIDVVLKLQSIGHSGKISMYSRTGLLPAVLAKNIQPYNLKYLTLANVLKLTRSFTTYLRLDDFLNLCWQEIQYAEKHNAVPPHTLFPQGMVEAVINSPYLSTITQYTKALSALDWLNYEISSAERNVKTWQGVLFAIYPILSEIWTHLLLQDKELFIKEYNTLFMTYLAAFPLENAYKIREILKSGQLQVIGGVDANNIKPNDDHTFTIMVDDAEHKVDCVVNTKGTGYNVASLPLFNKLQKQGLINACPNGGIEVDPRTLGVKQQDKQSQNNSNKETILSEEYRVSSNLYAVGELTKGSCLATTDMTRLTTQCDSVMNLIVSGILREAHKSEKMVAPRLPVTQRIIYSTNQLNNFTTDFFKSSTTVKQSASSSIKQSLFKYNKIFNIAPGSKLPFIISSLTAASFVYSFVNNRSSGSNTKKM